MDLNSLMPTNNATIQKREAAGFAEGIREAR